MAEEERFHESYEVDWDDIKDIPPEGWYLARVSKARRRTSKKSGNPMAMTTFVVCQGDQEGSPVTTYLNLPVNKESEQFKNFARMLKPFLKAVGQAGQPVDPNAWEGEELWIRVSHEDWEGEARARVSGYRPADDPPDEVA